jgi:tetratricopeptide (TPR) repeat protein
MDERMAGALNGLAGLMINNGLLCEGLEAIEAALARLSAAATAGRYALVAHLEATRSLLLYRLGRLEESRIAGRRAEVLLTDLSVPQVAARAHLSLGMVQYLLWDLEDSHGHLVQALALATGDERLVVRVLNQLSEQAYGAGDRLESTAYATEAIRRARAAGYTQDELWSLIMLGNLQLFWERHAEAEATLEQVRTHPATPRWVFIETLAYGYLAQVWWEVLEYTRAATAIERALWLTRRMGMRHLEGLGLAVSARVALVSGDLVRAEELFASAMTIFQDLKTWRGLGRVQSEFALVAHRRGEDKVALARCDAALVITREHQLAVATGHALIHRGHALLALGEPQAAAEAYLQGREQMLSIGRHNRAAEALAGLALAELTLGRRDVARDHGNTLLTHLGGGWAAIGGMFDPTWVCLVAYDVLCDDDPQAAAAALAHGRAILERITAQFTPERAEVCMANIASLRRLSGMGRSTS